MFSAWFTRYCLRGLSHDRRRYVFCVIHVDFDVFFKVINNQEMFCEVYVDLDVLSKANHDQMIVCPVYVADDVFSQVNHDQMNVLHSPRRR